MILLSVACFFWLIITAPVLWAVAVGEWKVGSLKILMLLLVLIALVVPSASSALNKKSAVGGTATINIQVYHDLNTGPPTTSCGIRVAMWNVAQTLSSVKYTNCSGQATFTLPFSQYLTYIGLWAEASQSSGNYCWYGNHPTEAFPAGTYTRNWTITMTAIFCGGTAPVP